MILHLCAAPLDMCIPCCISKIDGITGYKIATSDCVQDGRRCLGIFYIIIAQLQTHIVMIYRPDPAPKSQAWRCFYACISSDSVNWEVLDTRQYTGMSDTSDRSSILTDWYQIPEVLNQPVKCFSMSTAVNSRKFH